MQVSESVITACGVAALLGVVIPVVLLLTLRKRLGCKTLPFWVGCGTFFLAAIVLESVVHNLVYFSPLGSVIWGSTWLYALYGGLMAGLFEETGRLFAMKYLRRRSMRPETALMYGAGHGGMEIFMLLAVGMVQNVAYAGIINGGQMEEILSSLSPMEQEAMTETFRALAESTTLDFLAGVVERIPALVFHICLSVFVWQAVTQIGKFRMYPIAIALHAFVDASAVLINSLGFSIWITELWMLLLAAAMGFVTWKIYQEAKE